jgi:molybdopterin-containing oxidoreductase family membrane subunit
MYARSRPLTLGILGYEIPLGPKAMVRGVIGEIRSMPMALRIWLAILLGTLALFSVASLVALPPGWEVFGTSPSFEWGLLIVGYVFFAIMTSGLCLSASLGTVFGIKRFRPFEKRHAILALLSLTTAFIVIALDLHYPIRMVFGAVFVPSPSSPMWWMGVFYGLYLVVLLVEVWTLFTDHPKIHLIACTGCAIVAVFAPATLGVVFGALGAKAFWAGIWTPIQMVATAVLLGTSILGIVFFLVDRLKLDDWERAAPIALPSVRLLMVIALSVATALLVRQVVAGLEGDVRGLREATLAWIAGPLATGFWARALIGLVIPMVLLLLPVARKPWVIFGVAIMILVGVFLDRYLFVAAGQIYPMTSLSGTVAQPYAEYAPTWVEILIMVGGLAFMAFMYTLAERYLDMGHSGKHMFWPWPWIKDQDMDDVHEHGHYHEHEHEKEHEHGDAGEAPVLDPAAAVGSGPAAAVASGPVAAVASGPVAAVGLAGADR